MQRTIAILIMIMSAFVLVACGAAEDDAADTSGTADNDVAQTDETQADDPEFVMTVTGAVESDYAGNANFSCEDSGMENAPDTFELVMTNGTEQLYVSMPFTTEAGTHPLLGSDDEGAISGQAHYIRYRTEDRVTYDVSGVGTLTIENLPSEPREAFVGTIEATIANDDSGETVTITVEANVDAPSWAFDGCEADA